MAQLHQHEAGHVPEPHLPHGSPWPALMALAITVTGLGVIFWNTIVVPILGVLLVIGALIGWVREDVKWWWTNTGTGQGMARAGTLMFISSEVFIFGSLFATYFSLQRMSGGDWLPHDLHLPINLVLFFSLFLFASSFTIHQAEKKLFAGQHKPFLVWWGATILLGLVFLGGQVNEYLELIHEGQTLGSSHYMTMFYLITGTHGLHVFGGLVALLVAFIRGTMGQFDEKRHSYPQSTALYWHFVDLVWVFVLTVIYLIPVYVL